MKPGERHLAIFLKEPRLGRAKGRLARDIGTRGGLALLPAAGAPGAAAACPGRKVDDMARDNARRLARAGALLAARAAPP